MRVTRAYSRANLRSANCFLARSPGFAVDDAIGVDSGASGIRQVRGTLRRSALKRQIFFGKQAPIRI
jgi:hypothetical protein